MRVSTSVVCANTGPLEMTDINNSVFVTANKFFFIFGALR